MVNKVAVIAIVAILAVPILIGFGMNLEPTTKTEYLADKNPVIVTELLQNDVGYSNVPANIYQLNSDFTTITGGDTPVSPVYNTISSNYSSFQYGQLKYTGGNHPYWGGANGTPFSNWAYVYVQTDWFSGGHMNMKYMDQDNTLIQQVNRIHTFLYDGMEGKIHYTYYTSATSNEYLTEGEIVVAPNITNKFAMIYDAGFTSNFISVYRQYGDNNYANISDGYYFPGNAGVDLWAVNLPDRTSTALMTINLDSITDNTYNCTLRTDPGVNLSLRKSTSGGVPTWIVRQGFTTLFTLYYDQSRSDNTYQILFQFKKVRSDFDDTNTAEYDYHMEFRYVGSWPTTIGEANYYQKYEYDKTYTQSSSSPDIYLDRIRIGYQNVFRTPTIRMDAGTYAGMEFPVISNNTYDPAAFKTNPSTTIKDISRYGNSIIFAGNTYTVDSTGNITLGTHKISVDGIILDSVPVAGGYDNRINGTTISTTAQPSTIRFSGQWVANISTDSQSTNTYQTTVWHAGEFAWDGMDQNFLIVGLITSLGVFIGLGIYARKSNSKGVIPLMIVCGGAAALFFVML